jgi:hypothetical protein
MGVTKGVKTEVKTGVKMEVKTGVMMREAPAPAGEFHDRDDECLGTRVLRPSHILCLAGGHPQLANG